MGMKRKFLLCFNKLNKKPNHLALRRIIMKTATTLTQAIAISSFIAFTATATLAHSNHDHSTLTVTWNLSQKLTDKIAKSLGSNTFKGVLGINSTEQKNFDHYGIKVGHTFTANFGGMNMKLERVAGGIRIHDVSHFRTAINNEQLPLRPADEVKRVSINPLSHVGHDHNYLPVQWVFGQKTQSKLAKLANKTGDGFVGITRFEMNLLDRYNVKVGNRFHTKLEGRDFLVERTSSGLKVTGRGAGEA